SYLPRVHHRRRPSLSDAKGHCVRQGQRLRQCISPGADLPMPQRQCPQRACQRWATGHLRLSPNQVDRSMLRNMIRRLDQSPLIKLVEYAGKFAVLVTVMAFLWHHDQDVKAREAQAWDSIL